LNQEKRYLEDNQYMNRHVPIIQFQVYNFFYFLCFHIHVGWIDYDYLRLVCVVVASFIATFVKVWAHKSFEMENLIGTRLYFCFNCRNHVALHDDVISKTFQVNTLTSFSIKIWNNVRWTQYKHVVHLHLICIFLIIIFEK